MIRRTTTPEGEIGFDPLDHDAHVGIPTLKKKSRLELLSGQFSQQDQKNTLDAKIHLHALIVHSHFMRLALTYSITSIMDTNFPTKVCRH